MVLHLVYSHCVIGSDGSPARSTECIAIFGQYSGCHSRAREFGRNIRTYLVGPSFVQVPFGVRSPTLRSGARRDFAVQFDATSPFV